MTQLRATSAIMQKSAARRVSQRMARETAREVEQVETYVYCDAESCKLLRRVKSQTDVVNTDTKKRTRRRERVLFMHRRKGPSS
mmetsp:Transcript_11226/g.34385  ORF Transcript_11226/g.34385 Transcript_11226/m.34385 type:complete len:84 (-) Transcript_11226:256-507(-)